jgi:DNA-binding PadR family transcriptional regulator
VLSLICEKPTHGFAVASMLGPGGSLGQVWRVPKPVIYGAMQRQELLGLVRTAGEQDSSRGPACSVSKAIPAGWRAAKAWLSTPAAHARDVRSEFLVKLALLDRAEADPRELLRAQDSARSHRHCPR